ncbi:hypothetical protein [Cellulomonas persica]|uniref:Uncharacterized protein n=1 Tax=Cellulomonas persica TaxID=76861 RepID=A0A510V1V4_9CELL|nr:hypothetical protein [Cellulomonas persica]GEK19085.1 hypothetical protein CPE01_28180 [Cellulomonas persica]
MTTELPWSEPQHVDDEAWHRVLEVPCAHRGCPDGALVVNLMTTTDGPVPPTTARLVEDVVAALPDVLDTALDLLVATARAQPRVVGLDAAYAVTPDGLGDLSLVVDESDEWLVHVGECPFPAADPYGIAVRMRGVVPVALETLDDAEEL